MAAHCVFNLKHRVDNPEIMDTIDCTTKEMTGTLSFLRITNLYFGGWSAIAKHLNEFSRKWSPKETVKILDVGCGLADIPVKIAQWAAQKKIKVEVTGAEIVPQIAQLAKNYTKNFPNIRVEQLDILSHDSLDNAYDYVLASLFLHHVPSEKLSMVFKKLNRIAKSGIIISDLERSLSSYCAVSLLSTLIGNRIVRHDGPISVQRSFTIDEIQYLACSNGLGYLKARREPFFRLSLSGEKR